MQLSRKNKLAAAVIGLLVFGFTVGIILDQINTLSVATIDTPRLVATVNQPLAIPILLDTKDKTINAAEVYFSFDPKLIRIDSIVKDNSIFKIWIDGQPSFSNEQGAISLAGGLPNPGFKGQGQLAVVNVMPLQKGVLELTPLQKTRILVNDGNGSNLPFRLHKVRIKVK